MRGRSVRCVVVLGFLLSALAIPGVSSAPIANDAFYRTWERTDQPVAAGAVSRTWMWGPEAFSDSMPETYAESPGGQRTVQYFDKSRMEITNPSGDQDSPWYVTNGLLVVELMTGQMQTGNNAFEPRQPANVNVAGDPGDPLTYAVMAGLRSNAPASVGSTLTQRVNGSSGAVTQDPAMAGYLATAATLVAETNHTVASPFWTFMNSSGLVNEDGAQTTAPLFQNPFYATGFPITEAYWASVAVGGQQRDLLVQCFERRCLTYNPANDPAWQVEAGNVGQHYYEWRYGDVEPAPTGEQGVVTRVVDGDTFDVDLNGTVYRVRMIGIDTPEVYGGVDCYGPEASAATKQLIEGKTVRLVKDVSETDRYDRLLRYVYLGDLFVNDWLVRNGYAYASTYPPDVAHSQQFAAAQSEAQAAGRGLWAGCSATPTQPPAQPTATPTQPPAQPTATPPSSTCHPSYPDFCIKPPPPDLNCSDFPASVKPIRVLWNVPNPDPHKLDGNKDGWGCEG